MKAKQIFSTGKISRNNLAIICFLLLLTGCQMGSDTPPACSGFDCLTSKFNLVTANLDGSDLVVIAKDSYREMTHPRITYDRKWIAYTRHNKLNTNGVNGCAEVKNSDYTNTEIRATNMDGSKQIALTTPDPKRLSTNSYWIDNTYNFTFLDGVLGTTLYPSDVTIKRSYRDSNLLQTSVVAVPVPATIFVTDPQQVGNKIVFAGMWDISDIANDYKSIFTIDENGVSSPIARTIAMGRGGTLPVSAVIAAKAFENDPKFSPDGTRIAFMRKINTTNSTYDHGFHIFITSASGVPGSEVDISDATIGHDPFFNDAVPEWVDNNNLVFSIFQFRYEPEAATT